MDGAIVVQTNGGPEVLEWTQSDPGNSENSIPTGWLMLILLWVTAEAFEPGVVVAHLLRPDPDHGFRHGVGTTQGGQVGDAFLN